jgi:hypothetical protein
VIPWTLLDTAPIPGGEGELRLKRRGAEFSITLGNIELMNSRLSGSEEALAKLSCERFRRPQPRVLRCMKSSFQPLTDPRVSTDEGTLMPDLVWLSTYDATLPRCR